MQLTSEKELKWGNKFESRKIYFNLPSFSEVMNMVPLEKRPEVMEALLEDEDIEAVISELRDFEKVKGNPFIDEIFSETRKELLDSHIGQIANVSDSIKFHNQGSPSGEKLDHTGWLDLMYETRQVSDQVIAQLQVYPQLFEDKVRTDYTKYYEIYTRFKELAKQKVKIILKEEGAKTDWSLKEILVQKKDKLAMWLLRIGN